jgi:hypothetical protein
MNLGKGFPVAKIFLSYSMYDRDYVERLERALESKGHTVTPDRGEVSVGSTWAETIRDAIDQFDVLVVLVSQESLGSDAAVGAEVGAAWGRGKRIVAIETSDVSAASSLRLPRADYEVVSAKGMSDDRLATAILEKASTAATNATI